NLVVCIRRDLACSRRYVTTTGIEPARTCAHQQAVERGEAIVASTLFPSRIPVDERSQRSDPRQPGPCAQGVGTPMDLSRACARPARALRPSRYVLMSLPGRFSTLHPSRQYSSICASVSAEPRASLPCLLQASTIRRTAALKLGCSRSRWTPNLALRSEWP